MHHIPLIFYAPNKIISETRTDLCGQTDILPSIGHLLKIPFNNKPLSINLFNEKRKALSFTYDEQLIGINDSAFFVSRQYNSNLFLKNKEKKYCPVLSNSLLAKNLNNYSLAIMELARRKLFEEK